MLGELLGGVLLSSPLCPWQQVVLIILCWELLKQAWQMLSGGNSVVLPDVASSAAAASDEDQLNLPVPPDPHIVVVIEPNGLHWSNPKEVFTFETEETYGTVILFHAPTGDGNQFGPGNFDYNDYFLGKSRLWEMRVHMHFKRTPSPEEEKFFGIELEDYVPLSRASAQAQKVIVAGIRKAIGNVYHTPGDDPTTTPRGVERERPCCVLPLWAFDQFIETPEGEEPPSLTDPNFSELGKKRYKRIAEYAKEIKALEKSFRSGPTYTLAFWGNSRFLDVINWTVVGVPIVTPSDFNNFAGKPPVHVVFYSVKRGEKGDNKHLQSRKTSYFRAALWSSTRRPDPKRIADLLGCSPDGTDLSTPMAKKKLSWRRRISRVLTACTPHPY